MIKKAGKIIFIILLIAVCIFSVVQKAFLMPVHNVFDEMYYSGYGKIIGGRYVRWGSYVTNCSYEMVKSIEQVNGFSNMHDEYMAEDFGRFERFYQANELNKGESITINVYLNKKEMEIVCRLKNIHSSEDSSDSWLQWGYSYSVEENIMYINGPTLYFSKGGELLSTTDKEQIESFLQENGYDKTAEEYEHYFLYDKIIHDWTMGNLFRSRYTTWRIGRVKFVDGPPPEQTA